MRIEYSPDGSPRPIFEVGDYVRLSRDEEGPIVMARAGDWGQVVKVNRNLVDIRMAGFCRPRTTDIPLARDVPRHCLQPCDRSGATILLQRDLRTPAPRR